MSYDCCYDGCFPCIYFFFFQAEDGIRDYKVTGVQTCALPIWITSLTSRVVGSVPDGSGATVDTSASPQRRRGLKSTGDVARSEERRVGKECRCRWGPEQ